MYSRTVARSSTAPMSGPRHRPGFRAFTVLDRDFDADGGVPTPTLKV
jgi:hypothetical protein